MSLQVHDPRSRTRSKSPGRERSRSRSRDSRVPSPSPSRGDRDRERDRSRARSPALEVRPKSSVDYAKSDVSNQEAEIERQYRLLKESRLADDDRNVVSRAPRSPAPRSPAPYDVRRSDEEDSDRRRGREQSSRRRRRADPYDDRYEHSDQESDVRLQVAQPREHPSRSPRRSSPPRSSRHDSDSEDDGLAYGDAPGAHPSYARPGRFQYAQPANYLPTQSQAQPQPPDWAPVPECERPGFVPPASQPPVSSGMPGAFPPASTYVESPATTAPTYPAPQYAGIPSTQPLAYASSGGYTPSHYRTASASDVSQATAPYYAQPGQFQYAQVDPNVRYTSKTTPTVPYAVSAHEQFSTGRNPDPYANARMPEQHHRLPDQYASKTPEQPAYPYRYSHDPQFGDRAPSQSHSHSHSLSQSQSQSHSHSQSQLATSTPQQVVEITPGGGRGRPHSLSVSSANNLVVASPGGHLGHPPASPLLEPYKGTYQSMSPMPSPIMMPTRDDDISDLEPLDGGSSLSDSGRRKKKSSSSREETESRHRSSKDKKEKDRDRDDKRRRSGHDRHDSSSSFRGDDLVLISPSTGRKRVSFYDAASDASAMQSALNHTRNIDNKAIIAVLPRLTTDEILLLRAEYKNKVKMHGKGINLAKHLRLKLGNSSFGKVAYATALGRWESEAYWANCYYQAGTSRRELLIESLIGRSNAAIREIKSCFRDTRYDNSLERCMRSELRADKFRVAVLLALEERRQDERDPIDARLVRQDVSDLHRALVSRDGGETAMIQIIVTRSDAHLREVLRAYEAVYGHNFARAMIAKSRNLVGETLAHILNGAINRPMRDALLLHQALRESRSGRERSELLISRLVRLHWEPKHLEKVKIEYRRRYDERLEEAIAEEVMSSSTGAEWGEFCIELVRSSS
ncbi:hypothetical protein N7532_001617 [Penicillium argentinense]|uniref:Annexin n=1 Tax=Penicillium argentinense TaxID=1131581 RepID=A0A9W9G4F5_9EURO|nr:uncharacterized protein N7532_001617 [Penicillium argentinense]KAJ5111082.1 hypothetical protein N7532_001617 [Penicillium argentinense]